MSNPIPFRILLDARRGEQAYAYFEDPDPSTVRIACLTPETCRTIGPWSRDQANRHIQALQAAGYIAYAPVEESLHARAAEPAAAHRRQPE
jgi:hypothetical protein